MISGLSLTKKFIIGGSSLVAIPSCYGVYSLLSHKPGTGVEVPLSSRPGFESKYGKESMGRKHGNYFKDASENSDWLFWDSKKGKLGEANSEFFKNLSDGQQLRKKCGEFYEKQESTSDTNSNLGLEVADAWFLCSDFTSKPARQVNSNGSHQVGSATQVSTKMMDKLLSKNIYIVDAGTTGNEQFWTIRDKEFRGEDGLKLDIENESSYKWFNSKKTKDLCKEAYEMDSTTSTTSTTNNPSEDEVAAYCSIFTNLKK